MQVAVEGGAEHVAKPYPIHVLIPKGEGGLAKDSIAMCNQIRCVDEARFGKTYGHVSPGTMARMVAPRELPRRSSHRGRNNTAGVSSEK